MRASMAAVLLRLDQKLCCLLSRGAQAALDLAWYAFHIQLAFVRGS